MSELPWSHLVTEIPASGLTGERIASEPERRAVGKELELLAIKALAARYRIRPTGGGRYRLTGDVEAEVEQACVVTLEPVPARIAEHFDVEFWPEGEAEPADEGEVEALSAPEIEPIENGRIDVGRIVFEQLAAGLDPFPRMEGATLDHNEAGASDAAGNPFSVLASLPRKT